MNERRSESDWERVRREAAEDAPVAYDPEDDLYDPNDDAAVEAFWREAKEHRSVPNARGDFVKVPISRGIVEHFLKAGPDWEAAIDAVLRDHVARTADPG